VEHAVENATLKPHVAGFKERVANAIFRVISGVVIPE